MKSHIPAINVFSRIKVFKGLSNKRLAKESMIRRKRGRLLGSKDMNQDNRGEKSMIADPIVVRPPDENKGKEIDNEENSSKEENLFEEDMKEKIQKEDRKIENYE